MHRVTDSLYASASSRGIAPGRSGRCLFHPTSESRPETGASG